ncbi:hypothetical protein MMC11_007343 [Xylographa trunciseda]|nr:hypothetical protein [Xylographa trunciseda]
MDPLSGTASVIAVLQLASSVLSACYRYQDKVRHAKKDILYLADELESLRNVLKSLKKIEDDEDEGSKHRETVKASTAKTLDQCYRKLAVLDEKLSLKDGLRGIGQILNWPLKADDVSKIHGDLERFKGTLTLALATDLTTTVSSIDDNLGILSNDVHHFQTTVLIEEALKQISTTDPSENHVRASNLRHPTTGEWLLHRDDYLRWKLEDKSFWWLHGTSGCGKTVLCSTIIENLMQHCKPHFGALIGYYYFDFTDTEKQKPENMLSSLVAQFVRCCQAPSTALAFLGEKAGNRSRRPTSSEIMNTLKHLINSCQDSYIIIDALDECIDIEALFRYVEIIAGWESQGLHILVTSQSQQKINTGLARFVTFNIALQGNEVDEDIRLYISEKVRTDPQLGQRHVDIQRRIEDVLMEGANGM